jgi:hypothetical protein
MNDPGKLNPQPDPIKIWDECLTSMRLVHTDIKMDLWLDPLTPIQLNRDATTFRLTLVTETDQKNSKISSTKEQFKHQIESFLSKSLGEPVDWVISSSKKESSSNETADVSPSPLVTSPPSPSLTDNYQIALPFANEEQRPITNGFLRSAFFGLNRPPSAKREKYENQLVATVAGYTIIRSGEQLDQDDLTTWSTIIQLAAGTSLQKPLIITAYQLLKTMGLTDCANNYKLLDDRLRRLKKTTFELDSKDINFIGSLIDTVTREKYSNQYRIRFSVDLAKLYASEQYTKIEWNVRSTLAGKSLAQWLHGYFSSHASPFPISITKLHSLCGSTTAKLKDFRPILKKALTDLKAACIKNGEKFDFSIQDDLVYVIKSGSPSQSRHLLRKANQLIS